MKELKNVLEGDFRRFWRALSNSSNHFSLFVVLPKPKK